MKHEAGMAGFVIHRRWSSQKQYDLERRAQRLYTKPPRIGMVVGTFAALPYIHLQLEARRRLYPQIPMLVHDDASHKREALAALCEKYGAEFEYNDTRMSLNLGDLSCFVGGLAWAKERSVDLLLKVSRRFVFRVDWTTSLSRLAIKSQYATFSNHSTSFDFGFRSECVGLSTAVWGSGSFLDAAALEFRARGNPFLEGYLHDHARKFERLNCALAQRWESAHPKDGSRNGYADWPLIGNDRCAKSTKLLWHDANPPRDYFRLAKRWNLPYTESDFVDPNAKGR